MYPFILTVLLWERELENQRHEHGSQGANIALAKLAFWARRKSFKEVFTADGSKSLFWHECATGCK